MQKLRLCGNAWENARVQRKSVGTVLGMASAAVLLPQSPALGGH
jgi:hypothetical protein